MTALPAIPATLILAALPLAAQLNPQPSLHCDGNKWRNGNQRFCEMREFPVPASSRLSVDSGTNGGISVKSWDRADALVRAKVEAWAPSEGEARSLATQINVQANGANIGANAPEFGKDRGWAVSFEIFVPRQTDLALKAHNGGISIEDVRGNLEFSTVNGGATLKRLAGTVHGKTVNGGLNIELEGSRWDGNELDVRATNGGVTMMVPGNYSARLETATVNGGIAIDFPVNVQGKIGRELSFNLGSGGALVRAITTNGGVTIRRKS